MTLTAVAEYFLVIRKGYDVEPLRRMTGLAGIAGCDVIQRLARNRRKIIVMTVHAIR